ncbi:MAG TPA: YceD family protein [Rhodanobacteraceae bacterium]
MSATLPDRVDAGRMVAARRAFRGSLPVSSLHRLAEAVKDDRGEVTYELEFGRDQLGVSYLAVRTQARLSLECQRTLEIFEHPLDLDVRLGLIEHERDEAGLPAGYEPLLLENGTLQPMRVIEDELLLALPAFPVKPGSESEAESRDEAPEDAPSREGNPFAVLRELKKH